MSRFLLVGLSLFHFCVFGAEYIALCEQSAAVEARIRAAGFTVLRYSQAIEGYVVNGPDNSGNVLKSVQGIWHVEENQAVWGVDGCESNLGEDENGSNE
jgi:hypothetical protein